MSGSSIGITLNGEPSRQRDGTTVEELLESLGLGERRVAVEVNLEVVRRDSFATHALADGDRVEVVSFVGGG